MTYQHLRIDTSGPVAWLVLNRPAKANALNFEHLTEIEDAAQSFREAPEVRVVVFTGAGKHFSGGADLDDAGEAYQVPMVQRRRRLRVGERAVNAIVDMDQITIAAWRGGAIGGGACLVTACDFRIGSEDCFMQYPEIDLGMNLMWKGLPLITALAGPARAKRLVIGNERINGPALAEWGLLDALVTGDRLNETAAEWAARYAAKPAVAAQMIKRSVNQLTNPLGPAIMHMDVDQNLLAIDASREERQTASPWAPPPR